MLTGFTSLKCSMDRTEILLWIWVYGLNEEAWYATQSFMLFKQSSGIHFIYLFSKNQKEKLNKITTNMPVETFNQTNAKTTTLYCPS